MTQKGLVSALLSVCLLFSVADCYAAAGGVAVVDVDRVLDADPEFAAIEAGLQKTAEGYEEELEVDRKRIEQLSMDLEQLQADAANMALREGARAELRETAREKLAELRAADNNLRQNMQRLQAQLSQMSAEQNQTFFAKVMRWAEVVAQEQGFAIVLDGSFKSPGGTPLVLFRSEAVDITDAVIEQIPELTGKEPVQ